MNDDEDNEGGQVLAGSFKDRERAQGGVGEEYTEDAKTPEGKWNIKVKALSKAEGMKFIDIKQTADQIKNYLNLNPYTFVLAYKIVNFTGDNPIDAGKLKDMKTKIDKGNTPIEKEPFSNFMELSDLIRYAYLIRSVINV
jgi:hypothetical protein